MLKRCHLCCTTTRHSGGTQACVVWCTPNDTLKRCTHARQYLAGACAHITTLVILAARHPQRPCARGTAHNNAAQRWYHSGLFDARSPVSGRRTRPRNRPPDCRFTLPATPVRPRQVNLCLQSRDLEEALDAHAQARDSYEKAVAGASAGGHT
jgi:hypothetical protein